MLQFHPAIVMLSRNTSPESQEFYLRAKQVKWMLNLITPSDLSSQFYDKRKLLLVLYLKMSILWRFKWEIGSTKRWCSSVEAALITVLCCGVLYFKTDTKTLERFKENYNKEWFKLWKTCAYNYKLKGKDEELIAACQYLHGKDFCQDHGSVMKGAPGIGAAARMPCTVWEVFDIPIWMTSPRDILMLRHTTYLFRIKIQFLCRQGQLPVTLHIQAESSVSNTG